MRALNTEYVTPDDWADNSRDMLNFLLHYLPDAPMPDLPLHLSPVSSSITATRRVSGFTDRTLIGVGHSLGGVTTAWAACEVPQLFSSLVLIDPIIESRDVYYESHLPGGAVKRRTRWSSRAEAMKAFQGTPFFAAWDPEVLDSYVKHGLHTLPSGEVELKMSGVQEATVFADFWSTDDVFQLLPDLDPRIALRWIMPDSNG
jgi:pimeloyl-ACP methyl ester carboxylesterase